MSEQLSNEDYCTESCCGGEDSFFNNEYDSDNTPLQDQVEQQDAHIFSLEDALEKTVDVIAALMGERKDLYDQLYQAQVDAQDWQNRYNEFQRSIGPRICDAEQIRELTNEVAEANEHIANRQLLLETCRDLYRQACEQNDKLEDRILKLTDQNTQLEIRNERQAKRLTNARQSGYATIKAINGLED